MKISTVHALDIVVTTLFIYLFSYWQTPGFGTVLFFNPSKFLPSFSLLKCPKLFSISNHTRLACSVISEIASWIKLAQKGLIKLSLDKHLGSPLHCNHKVGDVTKSVGPSRHWFELMSVLSEQSEHIWQEAVESWCCMNFLFCFQLRAQLCTPQHVRVCACVCVRRNGH